MKINIVCSEAAGGWIYNKFIDELKKHSKHEILINAKDNFDIVHFLPYYEYHNVKSPSTAWFSHMEQKEPLKSKFFTIANQVDVAISHSKKYFDLLTRMKTGKSIQIMPGVDLDKFKPKSYEYRLRKNDKPLIVGYVGRTYSSSNRKNPTLLDKISKLPGIEFRATNGKILENNMPNFYNNVDIIVSPSTIEGGPMCIIEALAVGKPIICFQSVGVSDEFDFGLIKVPDFNEKKFIEAIEQWRDGQLVLNPPNATVVSNMRNQVINFTWENFVRGHDEVWNNLSK